MKLVVIGPGALGCLLAAYLSRRGGDEIWLLDYDRSRVEQSCGRVVLEEGGQTTECPVRVTADPGDIGPAQVVLLCVKSGAVRAALQSAHSLLEQSGLLVAFQNGIGHLDHLQELSGRVHTALAVTTEGATLLGPWHVRHSGRGKTQLGLWPRAALGPAAGELLAETVVLFQSAGLTTRQEERIIDQLWNKLLVNVGINALTVIYNCKNGELLRNDEALARMERAVREAAAVARAKAIAIGGDPVALTRQVCRSTADNVSSMLQDVRRQRATEIGAINGAIVAAAAQVGLKAPENEELVRQIREIEKNYLF